MSIIPASDLIDANTQIISRSAHGVETIHHDDGEGTFTIARTEDIEPLLDANKQYQRDHDGWTPSRDMKYVAEVPMIVIEQWNNTYGVNVLAKENFSLLKRLLNDPDNAFFRTGLGAI